MILITGATGQLGHATIEHLLTKIPADNIAGLVRDESKASDLKSKGVDIRKGEYDDYESLVNAMKGVEKVLLVSGTDIANRLQQHKNVIDAAKATNVKHIVYTSFERKTENKSTPVGLVGTTHIETDKYIKASGLDYTLLKNTLYSDMLPMFFGENVLENGIYLPAGYGKVPYATRKDLAEATGNVLAGEGHKNKEYAFSNTVNYSFYDAADILSEITGKEVKYYSPDVETFKNTLLNAGLPQEAVDGIIPFTEAIKQGEFETQHSDLEKLLGRKPVSLKDYLRTVYGA